MPDLPFELETVQPVATVTGAVLYNRVSRAPCPPPDVRGEPIEYRGVPLLIELDEGSNVQRITARSDGVEAHLLRRTLAPTTREPEGYFLSVPTPMRATVVRDPKGQLCALETEPKEAA